MNIKAIANSSKPFCFAFILGLLSLTGCNSVPSTAPPANSGTQTSPSPLPPVPTVPNAVPSDTAAPVPPPAVTANPASESPAAAPNPAAIEGKVGKIEFQSGGTTATVQGSVASKAIARYTFDASAGQPATITIESPNQDVLLTFIDPQGSPIQRYQSGSASWSGTLSESGTYTIDAFAAGADSTFTIKVSIQPKP